MTVIVDAFTIVAVAAGAVFFLAGALGLLRFPDTLSRLHALSKADNLGLGLIVLGLLPQTPGCFVALKLIGIWLLAQLSAATVSRLIASAIAKDMARS
ncbi:MAG: monovalent cation/H(+) antiporter subunit G [Hyphomicrobiaceae bacterium]